MSKKIIESASNVPMSSFNNCLEISNDSGTETRNISKDMQRKNYEGKSKKGKEKCASIIMDAKNVHVQENNIIEHESQKGFTTKGNTIRILNAELWTKHVGKDNVSTYYIPKGTRVYLRASSFELKEDMQIVKYTSLRSGNKEKGFDIRIDGKIFFMNPSLFPEGINVKMKK